MRRSNNADSTERHPVKVKCSRCHATTDGVRGPGFTGGFYDVSEGYWRAFSRAGEKRLCDRCMHESPEYQHVYGVLSGLTDNRETPRGKLVAYKLKMLAAAQNNMPQGGIVDPSALPVFGQQSCCLTGAKSPVPVQPLGPVNAVIKIDHKSGMPDKKVFLTDAQKKMLEDAMRRRV